MLPNNQSSKTPKTMLKKLRKTLSEEFKKRYEKMEGRYLGLENRIYTTIEGRLDNLEKKFDELSDILKVELKHRKDQNNDKLELMDDFGEDSKLSEKAEEVKEAIADKIQDAKSTVSKKVDSVAKKAKKAKKAVTGKLKKAKKNGKKVKKEVSSTINKVKMDTKDDLTKIKGLGEKISDKLNAEGITTFKKLSGLSKKEVKALDEKIKGFAARYERYNWNKQAGDLK